MKDFYLLFSQGIRIPVNKQSENIKKGLKRFLRIIDFTSQNSESPRYIEHKDMKYHFTPEEVSIVRYGNSMGFICRRLEGIIANNLFKISPKDITKIGNNFIYYFLTQESIQSYFKGSSTGSAMTHDTVGNITFIIPSGELMNKFEQIQVTECTKRI